MPIRGLRHPINLFTASDTLSPPLVPFQAQRRSRWCWAACVGMVLDKLQRPLEQCDIVSARLGVVADCCGLAVQSCSSAEPDAVVSACDRTLDPDAITQLWAHHQVPATRDERPLEEDELHDTLQAGRVVQLWWDGRNGAFDHVVLVAGEQAPGSFLVADQCNTSVSCAAYSVLLTHRGGWKRTWTLEV